MTDDARRPLKTRSTAWARTLAQRMAQSRITPNQISVLSIGFALVGGVLLLKQQYFGALIGAALCVQLRLLCNLIDGMVAIEGGKGTPVGALYNEIPDRVADSLLLIAAGHGCGQVEAGWLAALAAAITAYIRTLGGALGLKQDFRGPQSKPQRMALLTLACIAAAIEIVWFRSGWSMPVAIWLIAIGTLLTCAMRTRAIARELNRVACAATSVDH